MSTYKFKIAIDVDGVLANTVEAILPIINTGYSKNLNYTDINEFSFPIEDTHIGKIIMNELYFNEQFTLNIKPYKNVSKIITKLYKNYTIVILTSRPIKSDLQTKKWLEKYKIPYNYYINSYGCIKGEFNWDILIDDCADNFEDIDNRMGILIDQPWNKNCVMQDNIYKTDNLLEAFNIIKKLKKG